MKFFYKKKKVIFVSAIFILAVFFLSAIPYLEAEVTSEDCYDAYIRCMTYYTWTGPFAYPYCLNGYMFCMLFVV